jgi:hypothetical protein
MNTLKSLTFTTLTHSGNPILDRRAKVIARLEEQKLILKDPTYTRTNRKWVKKDGKGSWSNSSSACRCGGDSIQTAHMPCSFGAG